jgi:DNA-binding NarL/FixJ family response regulator
LSDKRQRGERGLSVTEKVKREHPEIPVIVLTVNDDPFYRQAAYESGAGSFLVKGKATLAEIAFLVASMLRGLKKKEH